MKKIGKPAVLILLAALLIGCYPVGSHVLTPTMTTGVYTKLGSSAPSFGPIYVGTTRAYAERYLGTPTVMMWLDENHYINVYEYERERSVRDTIMTDFLDVVTFGLGEYMISPSDRVNGTRHLMAVTFLRVNKHGEDDRVVSITDRLTNHPLAIHYADISRESVTKSDWDGGIEAANRAILLDPHLASPYVDRARINLEKGRLDDVIRDCNRALALESDHVLALHFRGKAYQSKGDRVSAAKDFKRACKLGMAEACAMLATVTVKK